MSTTSVIFSNLADGEVVTNQLTDIIFTSPAPKAASDPTSPLPNILLAARAGGAVEFPTWSIQGTLASKTHSRFGITVDTGVTIDFKDKNGNAVATYLVEAPTFPVSTGFFYSEFATGKANLASFNIHHVSGGPFRLASISFDTVGVVQKPDFRLVYSTDSIPDKKGEIGSVTVKVARLYGSTGVINLSVSTTPPGLFVSQPIAFIGADGATATIPLTGTATTIQTNNIITISGVAVSASAGTVNVKRPINHTYVGPLQLPPP